MPAAEIRRFRRTVYEHHRRQGRSHLPWRRTADPYRIFVSEIMLQQTQVPRVIEKYESFIARFPDFAALARAPLRDILREWSGLGYNRRALHLKRAAERIAREYGGALPERLDDLVTLPGVGRATAAAVAAFAFGAAHPFIETNIRTVFIHHFFPRSSRVSDAEILPLVERTLDRGDPRRWYSALMDYGASLKRSIPNPSRRSVHRARQGKFEGSDRQARGLIVRALAEENLDEDRLSRRTGIGVARMRRNLARLLAEGMVAKRGKTYRIAP